MIPIFPEFKKLERHDKAEIEAFTHKHAPYSDFNFISMWSWDVQGEHKIAMLNGNLVLRFTDYLTNEPFYSFLGDKEVSDTAFKLLEISKKEGINPRLRLIPEICVQNLDAGRFIVVEDEDNHDYIYHLNKLATYDGNKMRSKRNLVNRFNRQYNAEIRVLDSTSSDVRDILLVLFTQWATNKNRPKEEVENELAAIDKAITTADSGNLVLVGLFIDDILAGFVLNEILPDEHCILHFEKADERYEGIYAYLMAENAKILSSFGKKYLNYEQDLGLPGLRLGKKSYRPNHYYKKYIVTPNEKQEL